MDVVADLPTHTQSPEPVQQREALLDHPTMHPEPGTVLDATASDQRCNTLVPHLFTVLVVVVSAIGVESGRASTGTSTSSPHRRDRFDQGHELGDVVAVAAGQCHCQRDAVPFGDQMVFRAGSGTVDRARPGFGPPLSARTWEPSITARDQSNAPAALSSANNDSCNRCQTPAVCQSRNRRQQVMPEP